MPNPRKQVRYEGIGYRAITLKIDNSTITYDSTKAGGSAGVGLAVSLSAADTVQLAADAEAVVGKLILVEPDGYATVQIEGFMDLPGGNGATLTLGTPIVGALNASSAKGYIRSAASGTAAELLKAKGTIYNAATPATTWVKY